MKNIPNLKKSLPNIIGHARNPILFLQHEIDKIFYEFNSLFESASISSKDIDKLIINPSIDLVEDNKTFKVEVEMPGMDEKDIKVIVSDNMLSIKGRKETSRKDEGKNYISREIGYGYYEKNIPIPDDVEIDKAKASFKKGMLWVSFPKKSEASKPSRELKIENAAAPSREETPN